MTDNLTDHQFLPMNDLCDDSLEALIQHYLSLKHKMPDNECLSPEGSKHDKSGAINLTVRERLLELEREQFEREKEQETNDN
jgi:hypothetical protein